MIKKITLIFCLISLFSQSQAAIELDQKAPDFTLNDQHNTKHALSDYQGQWVILYFYPKDDTPG